MVSRRCPRRKGEPPRSRRGFPARACRPRSVAHPTGTTRRELAAPRDHSVAADAGRRLGPSSTGDDRAARSPPPRGPRAAAARHPGVPVREPGRVPRAAPVAAQRSRAVARPRRGARRAGGCAPRLADRARRSPRARRRPVRRSGLATGAVRDGARRGPRELSRAARARRAGRRPRHLPRRAAAQRRAAGRGRLAARARRRRDRPVPPAAPRDARVHRRGALRRRLRTDRRRGGPRATGPRPRVRLPRRVLRDLARAALGAAHRLGDPPRAPAVPARGARRRPRARRPGRAHRGSPRPRPPARVRGPRPRLGRAAPVPRLHQRARVGQRRVGCRVRADDRRSLRAGRRRRAVPPRRAAGADHAVGRVDDRPRPVAPTT